MQYRRNNYMLLAEESYLQNDKEAAVEFYKRALSFQGNLDETILILFNIAIIYDELGELEKSKDYFSQILDLEADNYKAIFQLALLEEGTNNKEEALSLYHKIIDIKPDFKSAYYNIASILDEEGKVKAALKYYKRVIDIEPNHYHALNNIGSICEELGDYENAFLMVKKSIDINPDFFKSLFNMGVIYKRLGNHKMSKVFYQRAKDKNPAYPYIYLNLSAIYIEEESYEKSIEILTEGLRMVEHADLYYNRACCYSIYGEEELAIKDIKSCLLKNPHLIDWVLKDKDFKNLYNNEEFKKIIKERN